MKILILKIQTIGDTLLITPLIRNLFFYYKDVKIDVIVNEGTDDILNFNNKVRRVFVYKRKLYRSFTAIKRLYFECILIKKIRKEKYDVVIDLDQGDKGAILAFFSNGKVRIGSPKVKAKIAKKAYTDFLSDKFKTHTITSNLEPLKILGIPILDSKLEMCWSEKSYKSINDKINCIDKFVHIHPFSKLNLKELTEKTVSEIIDYCQLHLKLKVIITSGAIERETHKLKKILNLCSTEPVSFSNLTIGEVSVLNASSIFFIGVDTSLMHISAANNKPILAFFGPTSPKIWGPWDNDLSNHNFNDNIEFQKVGIHRIYSDVNIYNTRYSHGYESRFISPNMDIVKKQLSTMKDENIDS